MSSTLGGYAADRIRTGVTRAEIREELVAVGWSEEEADAAYRDGLLSLGVPVPTSANRPTLTRKSSTADIVVNFFSFAMLGVVATALGTLYFQIINIALPDRLDQAGMAMGHVVAASIIHYSIAALVIGFPLYFFAMRLWFRAFREDEGRVESRLSKWLTYLVLLVTAGTIVGDLIAAVYTYLQGEITGRFSLKAFVILAIAGTVFGFYFLERRKIQYRKPVSVSTLRGIGIGVLAAVVIGIVLGFWSAGSPETARNRSLDMRRSDDLSSLANCVEAYASEIGMLPSSLDDIRRSSAYSYCSMYMDDPETSDPYSYRVVTPSRSRGTARVGEFELCATFALPSENGSTRGNALWYDHEAGRVCKTATAQLGKPSQSVVPVEP